MKVQKNYMKMSLTMKNLCWKDLMDLADYLILYYNKWLTKIMYQRLMNLILNKVWTPILCYWKKNKMLKLLLL